MSILDLALQCGAEDCFGNDIPDLGRENSYIFTESQLTAFAARIRADALEEAAKACDERAAEWDSDAVVAEKNYAGDCAAAIRSLPKAEGMKG